jgi:thiamine-phosphate pyrophosphorylase
LKDSFASGAPQACEARAAPIAFPSSGLYAVTGEHHAAPEELALAVRAAIRGGALVIQYRAKTVRDRLTEARLLRDECRAAGVPLIVNDDVALAQAVGADGVHLGRDDCALDEARRRAGPAAIIGVSCYDSVERALEAAEQGADYVAFGRFFPSKTKPEAACARLETLREAKRRLHIPMVAIGGITPENGASLLAAGADVLAVIEGVFGQPDPEAAARRFQALFSGPG